MGGKTYHSGLEAQDALWLKQLEAQGEISELREQVKHRIEVNGVHITNAIVDFQFIFKGIVIWYETKGFRTDRFLILEKLIPATLPDDEMYIVNAQSLMEYMRGRTRKEK